MNSKLILSALIISVGVVFSSCDVLSEKSVSSKQSTTSSAIESESESRTKETILPEVSSAVSSKAQVASVVSDKKYGWGPGNIKNHERPYSATSYNKKFGEYDAFFVGDDDKKIYLTFDEGYENGYTAAILDTLKQKDVSAVFFVTYDYAKKNPELVKRMINEGHIVGNHSYTHPSLPTVSDEKAKGEITKLHDFVKTEYGYDMNLFRFPMGEFSERTLKIAKDLGYKSVFWSFAYADWYTDNQPEPDSAREKILSSTHNGAIYLLHAVSKTNTEILSSVIDGMREQGYEIAKLQL